MTQLSLSLDDRTAGALATLAQSKSVSREELDREVIRSFVRSNDRQRIHQEMRLYAEEMAPHSQEFVAESDAEVDDLLVREPQW